MRLGTFPTNGRSDVDDLFSRFFGGGESAPLWNSGGYSVPTDVFHMDDKLVIRMDLPGINPDDVEVTVQENTLLINGRRSFPFDPKEVRFARRGVFYGEFTQRVSLGKGLDVESINAGYDNGVLMIAIPYSAEVQPRKISIEVGDGTKSLNA
jgi:HSP20 family protein